MKRFLFLALTLTGCYFASGQDLIVTNQQDTIDCKITRVTGEFIHFTVYDESGIVLMRSRLPLSGIQYYRQSDEPIEEDMDEVPSSNELSQLVYEDFLPPKLRLSLNSGYTYQFGGYEGLPEFYASQLQSLWNLGGELHYFPTKNLGAGIKYSHARTDANADFQPPISTLFGFSQLRNERVRFNYFAISVMYRNLLYGDQAVHYFLSGGILQYRTDLLADGVPFYQDGETFGVTFGMVYDFRLFRSVGLGAGVEVMIANLSEYDNNGVIVPADFNVSRIDLTLGVRFYK